MRLPFVATFACFAVTLVACSGDGSSSSSAPASPGAPPAGTTAPPGSTPPGGPAAAATPGQLDPSCGTGGLVTLDGAATQVLADPAGALVVTSNAVRVVDAGGKLGAAPRGSGNPGWLVRAPDGSLYAVRQGTSGVAPTVSHFDGDLAPDASFAFEHTQWPATNIAGIAIAADKRVYVTGTVAQNTSQEHVVVRRFTATGALDDTFTPNDDAMPKEASASGIALAPDGGVLLRTDEGFTPAVLRLTASGALDTSFGDEGVAVLDRLGPRYSRAMAVDAEGRVVVLGMTNEDVQLARLLPTGALDASFGDQGVADAPLATKPLSSDYDERGEARDLTIDAQGRMIVTATYEYYEGRSETPAEQSLKLLRFDASGKLDPSFGDAGVAKVTFGADATASRGLRDGAVAPLGDGRLLVGGDKAVGATVTHVLACVKL